MAHGPAITRVLIATLAVASVAACGTTAKDAAPSAAQLASDLKGSPPPLAALHRKADSLLTGGKAAFQAQMRALRAYPVVVTQWASDCVPCQAEFPYFQQVSAQLGNRVAFIGVDASSDTGSGAKAWLHRFPVSFPSYRDSGMAIALSLSVSFADDTPVTYLYPRGQRGLPYFFIGPYLSERSLRQEIRHDLGV